MVPGARVVVVGGGIAGLTAAFRLQQAGCDVVVVEQSGPEQIGGRMNTTTRDGFAIDNGATLLLSSYHEMLKLAVDVGVADQVLPTGDIFGILWNGAVRRLRSGDKRALLKSDFVRGLNPIDGGKVAVDFLRMRSKLGWDDMTATAAQDFETVREYCLRRGLRPETYQFLLGPFTSGPALADPEEASLVSAFFAFNTIVVSGGGFTSADGVGFLPRALAARISVVHHARVTSIETRGGGAVVTWTHPVDGETVQEASAVVVAVPPKQATPMCPGLPPALLDYFRHVKYSRAVHVAFGLDRPTRESSLLLQIPKIEHPTLAAFVMEHNQAPRRVPAGKGLVMAHLRGGWAVDNWEMDDDAVVEHVIGETRRLGVLPEIEHHATFAEVVRLPLCTVIRRPGEYRYAARIAPVLRAQAPIHFAGSDYLGQSSTNGSLVSGERAAAAVLKGLRR
ncbi:FAD-dependent oxidoreductase [Lentzea alba]|uniref:protoporphyrinogen/coproporphyrinogen oxidase n=1 Tax=Lentzea alba TaxID=2714351 RepID=UPI0039BFAFBF